jgi:hypothetical protein
MHLIGVRIISLCLMPLGGKSDPRLTYGHLQGALIFDRVLRKRLTIPR